MATNCLDTNILQNILFCVEHMKEIHTEFGTTWRWINDELTPSMKNMNSDALANIM